MIVRLVFALSALTASGCFSPRGKEAAPADYQSHLRLAEAYRREGRFEEARGLYRKAQKLAPDEAQAYVEEGYSRRDAGDPESAVRLLEKSIAAHPGVPGYRHHLGVLFAGTGRTGEALRSFEEALRLYDPSDAAGIAHSKLHMAPLLRALGRREEALTAYRQAFADMTEISADWVIASTDYLDGLLESGRDEEGIALMRRAIDACWKGCSPSVNAAVLSNMAKALRRLDPDLSREYGYGALDVIETGRECSIFDDLLAPYRTFPELDSDFWRLEKLDEAASACSRKRKGR